MFRPCGHDYGFHHICNKGEIPGLVAVTYYSKWLSFELLGKKYPKDRPISPRGSGPGTIYVKETEGKHWELIYLSPVQYALFPQVLSKGIGVLRAYRGRLGGWIYVRDSITRRGSRICESLYTCLTGGLKNLHRPV